MNDALAAALAGVRRLAVDTAPLIYLIEAHADFGPLVREVVERAERDELTLVTSALTLTEALTLPLEHGAEDLAHQYRDLLLHTPYLLLEPIGPRVAERAAALRSEHRLKTPDAIQVATALEAGCQAFLTNDMALRRIDALRVVVLADL